MNRTFREIRRPRSVFALACIAALAMSACMALGADTEALGDEGDPSIGSDTSASAATCPEELVRGQTPADAQVIIDRAFDWIHRHVMYGTAANRDEGGYRTDCSGFVSMAWGLPAPGHSSYTFSGGRYDDHITYAISWDDVRVGDGLNRPARAGAWSGHSTLFGGWVDSAHTRYCSLEESAPGRPAHAIVLRVDPAFHPMRLASRASLTSPSDPPTQPTPDPTPSPSPDPIPPPAMNNPTPACGVLATDTALNPNEYIDSCDGRHRLIHQADGNVVLYAMDGRAIWNTRTNGQPTSIFAMQADGNLVLYNAAGRAIWNSHTAGHPGAALVLRNDADLVVYGQSFSELWSTGTFD